MNTANDRIKLDLDLAMLAMVALPLFVPRTERRARSRFPLSLAVRYKGAWGHFAGVGETANISSRGMFLACPERIPLGRRLKVVIEWPPLLNGETPLQLVTVGRVVRSTEIGVSVEFEGSHEFRTRGKVDFPRSQRAIGLKSKPIL
jgi:hypothetical protein